MDRITDKIWIGDYFDARDPLLLAKVGIRSILCLDGCMAGLSLEKLGVERVEVVELINSARNPPEKLLQAISQLRDLATSHAPVLVHCYAGQSRSAAVVCKFFMEEEGNTFAEAMRRITTKRRVAIMAGLQEALEFR
jgi:protein-tyrosine phosphatase